MISPSLISVPFDAWRIFAVSHANARPIRTSYSFERFVYFNPIRNAETIRQAVFQANLQRLFHAGELSNRRNHDWVAPSDLLYGHSEKL